MDVLTRFQPHASLIRPQIDEIVEASDPPAIVLKHLDDNLMNASATQKLTKREVKYVAERILEAPAVIHNYNYMLTPIALL